MSNPKYTPGPWAVKAIMGHELTIKGADGFYVCDLCGDEVPARANASLIAEAPAMRDALLAIVESSYAHSAEADEMGWTAIEIDRESIDNAAALLARIDGEN